MIDLLKKMRVYLIYNVLFLLVMVVGCCLMPGNLVGEDCDWIWPWMVVAYCVFGFEWYVAAPLFGLFYQIYEFTVKEAFLSILVVLVTTFLVMITTDLLLNGWRDVLEGVGEALVAWLQVSLRIAGTYGVVYFIARFICQKTQLL